MTSVSEFRPDWISPPGDTINDLLQEQTRSPEWLAQTLNRSRDAVLDLLAGRVLISNDLAQALSDAFGLSVHFWLTRDAQYRESVENHRAIEHRIETEFPYEDLARLGWIERTSESKVKTALTFFGVPNVIKWEDKFDVVQHNYAFSTSLAYESNPMSVAVWLRQAEIQAKKVTCEHWSAEGLAALLPEIRALTRQKDPEVFIPRLQAVLARVGVAFVALQPVDGCRLRGAAQVRSDGCPFIVVSARYQSDDHLWFTIFHEIAHLLLHREQSVFLDFEDNLNDVANPQIEMEANTFAEDVLVPPKYREALRNLTHEHKIVIQFSAEIGVSPGIIVGQMQKKGFLRQDWLNKLKRRYRWKNGKLTLL
jgi:HTH-type transcriptional regulator / antitoxin HigA